MVSSICGSKNQVAEQTPWMVVRKRIFICQHINNFIKRKDCEYDGFIESINTGTCGGISKTRSGGTVYCRAVSNLQNYSWRQRNLRHRTGCYFADLGLSIILKNGGINMKEKIVNRKFFEEKAEIVARHLIGKYICYNNNEYQITKTEAYYHDEKDRNGKYFCYGVKSDTGENNKTCATIPLFRAPGTWCVYGGQLLLSVTNSSIPDNVLIKEIKPLDEGPYGPDKIANVLLLYQKKSNSNYWNFHGLDSLSEKAVLYLAEDQNAPKIKIKSDERINIKNCQKYRFSMERK